MTRGVSRECKSSWAAGALVLLGLWCAGAAAGFAHHPAKAQEEPTLCSAPLPREAIRSALGCGFQKWAHPMQRLGERPYFRSGIEEYWCERLIRLGSRTIYVWHWEADSGLGHRDRYFLLDEEACIVALTRVHRYLGAGHYSRVRFHQLADVLSESFENAARQDPRRAAAAIVALMHVEEELLVPAMPIATGGGSTLPEAWEEGTVLQELPDGTLVVTVAGRGAGTQTVFLHELQIAKQGKVLYRSSEELDFESAGADGTKPDEDSGLLEKFIRLFEWR